MSFGVVAQLAQMRKLAIRSATGRNTGILFCLERFILAYLQQKK